MITLYSPIYPPYRGGGAEYIPWLQKIIASRAQRALCVVTESHPDRPRYDKVEGTVIHRTLVTVANFNGSIVVRVFRYALQNVQYLGILRHAVAREGRVLWFHGALFIHVSVLPLLVRVVKAANGRHVKLVLDIRDPAIPGQRLRHLAFFDEIISCCRRTDEQLSRSGYEAGSFWTIPVPCPKTGEVEAKLPERFIGSGLEETGFFLVPHGIRTNKNFPLIFRVWRRLYEMGHAQKLLVVGSVVNWDSGYQDEVDAGRLVIGGEISNDEVRMLMKHATLVFVIGRTEGLPRSVLEAIDVGALTTLPAGVPEFQEHDSDIVVDVTDEYEGAKKVANIIETQRRPIYDISCHREDNVARQYDKLLKHLMRPEGGG